MKKRNIVFIVNISATIIIGLIIYLSGWISSPTILSLPKDTDYNNAFIRWLFLQYNKDNILYILVITVLLGIITLAIYISIQKVTKWVYANIYSEKEIQEKFELFLNDINKVYVFGGDLSFLEDCPKQMEKITSIGSKCMIICEDISNKKNKNKDIYYDLVKANVRIKAYTESTLNEIKNFKGQIKCRKNGVIESLFVSKVNDNKNEYEVINLSNQYLSSILINNFKEVYNDSRNPLVKYIVLDLGGVYFDGDYFTDFLNPINEKLSKSFKINWDHKLLLDRELNLGKINIVQYVEKITCKRLSDEEIKFINEKWKSVWKPNENMKKLVKNLNKNGYIVTTISNLDNENGDMYKQRGDFEYFDNNLFFSYEYKLLKPSKQFFYKICEKYNIKSYEILFIDDHEKNISIANELGMETIKFCINTDPNLEKLYEQLKDRGIKF